MKRTPEKTGKRCVGFPPIVGESPRILVLGSMPSEASIAAGEYYAHRANRFWPLMARLFPEAADDLTSSDYVRRTAALRRVGVALWDTIGTCEREGSSDSRIRRAEPNDLAKFLRECPSLTHVILNGRKSEAVWRRHAEAEVLLQRPDLIVRVCPSTSPANAALRLDDLVAAWRSALASGKSAWSESQSNC